jgi:hypothetical protein
LDSPHGVVDSALPPEEEVRRFRKAVPERPSHLTGGERSRDALVRRWVTAIEARDSVALRQMVMTAAEFITFYYPESPYTHPPYRQSPALRWFLLSSASSQGVTRVWQRHAGQPLGYGGYSCNPKPDQVGSNRIWTACALRLKTATSETTVRLFGPIIERDGWYKFLHYGSDY